MRQYRPWLVLAAGLGLGVWLLPKAVRLPGPTSEGYEPDHRPMSHPLTKAVKDDRPAFHLDPGRPWRIEFGRGSGWHGLDTIKLDRDGRAVFHRMRSDRRGEVNHLSWETAAAQLPPGAVAEV